MEEALAFGTPEGSQITDKCHIISRDCPGRNPRAICEIDRRQARMRDDAPSINQIHIMASEALHLLSFGKYLQLTLFLSQLSSCSTSSDPTGSRPSQVPHTCYCFCKDRSCQVFPGRLPFNGKLPLKASIQASVQLLPPERPSAHPLPPIYGDAPSLSTSLPACFFPTVPVTTWKCILYLWCLLICLPNRSVSCMRMLPYPPR